MSKKHLWAAAHPISAEQQAELSSIIELKDIDTELHKELTNLQKDSDLHSLSTRLLDLCLEHKVDLVQPAGSPAFHFSLGKVKEEDMLANDGYVRKYQDILILFAFSKRESKDIPQKDGSIKKIAIFKHEGFGTV